MYTWRIIPGLVSGWDHPHIYKAIYICHLKGVPRYPILRGLTNDHRTINNVSVTRPGMGHPLSQGETWLSWWMIRSDFFGDLFNLGFGSVFLIFTDWDPSLGMKKHHEKGPQKNWETFFGSLFPGILLSKSKFFMPQKVPGGLQELT